MLSKLIDCVFRAYDWLFIRYYGLWRNDAKAENAILFHLIRYSGKEIALPDGTKIAPGDELIAIHVNRAYTELLQARACGRAHAGIQLRDDFRDSLRALAKRMHSFPKYRNVRALTGETILGAEAKHFGFITVQLEGFHERLARRNARVLISQTRNAGNIQGSTISLRSRRVSKIWMSREQLLRKYLKP
ncbi:MAG: hypothetical protein A2847_02360 [Candidatus Sungbacteria bacterium RIFCSPHIGHO2_01_FULL_50_25]|uniref:YkoP-like domain-containing protein n=1 Tax=Candidatus Sungbacteria bacterium RIFCSPHIGHO2_01_FULL_50_25 TaxID=1802265 RepID=A0A1G2KAE7_9BACT|nr:MAG: hypothetical protein A2847_02360 [Candidatus Sungbacteria bacterium RIFCSPHIGHO2_01_FULL_50_25]